MMSHRKADTRDDRGDAEGDHSDAEEDESQVSFSFVLGDVCGDRCAVSGIGCTATTTGALCLRYGEEDGSAASDSQQGITIS